MTRDIAKLAKQGEQLGKKFVEMQLNDASKGIEDLLKNPGDSLYDTSKKVVENSIKIAGLSINQYLIEHEIDATEYIERLNGIKKIYESLD